MVNFIEAYAGRHILVTGGAGYIGSAVLKALLDIPCTITVLEKRPKPTWVSIDSRAKLTWQTGDVAESAAWRAALVDVDTIFHLAAVEAPYSEDTIAQDYAVNSLSVVRMVEACRVAGLAPHMIVASSANIYGYVDVLPVNEDTPDKPGRIWSAHKLLAEHYLQVLSGRYNIPATILRLANVYGPASAAGSDEHIIPNKVIRSALTTQKLTLFANARCTRDYIYIDDVVAALLAAGQTKPSPWAKYVVGSGEGVTLEAAWRLMATVLQEITTQEITVAYDNTRELDEAEYRNFIADSNRFTTATSWRAATLLTEGLRATILWSLKK